MSEPLRLRKLLELLFLAEVRFVLVGGLAVNAWGYLRATRDLDVVPEPDAENLAKLDAVLKQIGGKVEVEDGLLDSKAISIFLKTGDRTLVVTDLGRVDILQGLHRRRRPGGTGSRPGRTKPRRLTVGSATLSRLIRPAG